VSGMAALGTALALFQALVLLAGVIVAYRGLNTWRHQRIEGRKIDIAEDALRRIARMKDIIFAISRVGLSEGDRNRIASEYLAKVSNEKRHLLVSYAAPAYLFQKYESEVQEFMDQRYICLAYFGPESVEYFHKIDRIIYRILEASKELVEHGFPNREDESTRARYNALRKIIHMGDRTAHHLHIETLTVISEASQFFGQMLRVR